MPLKLNEIDRNWPEIEISAVTADSRKVKPGMAFVAIPGSATDGREFIADAAAQGAAAIIVPSDSPAPAHSKIPFIYSPEPRLALARIAVSIFPNQPAHIAAVTGTNGKTSTVYFARAFWKNLGYKAASIGTLGTIGPDGPEGGALTTPDPVTLHQLLNDLAGRGVDHLACEASSHGLDQFRLDEVRIESAGFTNLTRDHLDYHGTMENYFVAKQRLFTSLLPEGKTAIVNADSDMYDALSFSLKQNRRAEISYGRRGRELRVIDARPVPYGIDLLLDAFGKRMEIAFPLAGEFQAWNALCAAGMVIGCGEKPETVLPMLSELSGVHGRLERVAIHDSGAAVYIDYAHTPDALETILQALRPHVEGRLVVVFGCGGNRDRGKRPIMGRIAERLADRIFVTDDNPRFEEANVIRQEILAGCPSATEIGDRRAAIAAALNELKPGDILVIAGKGHESGQIIGHETHPFDDAKVARELLGKGKEAA